ncbi:MAG: hypothetical protein NTY65_07240, partial [Planctomycetota bacterium]|nr:hypothetical protein [Planctomycetota bacterium]
AVQEMPPADRPAGAIWIPGYWAWDDDRSDFIWVSGMWRIAPPAGRWVPGYWAPVADGYQWVPGFWLADTVQQVQYLPTPPVSLETGPVGVAPSPDYIWSTGYWYRDSLQYAWRPGCWQAARADWVWVPAHYIWTPRGCVFVAGYWDYDMGRRGLLFAPVHFGRPLYARPGYCYSPMVVIETDNLSIALFSRPRYSHYYFGDYFEARYVSMGIVPWYECRTRRDWYDPIYFHAAWSHRHEARWEDREREHYDLLRRDVAARPPRTFALQAGVQRAAVQTLGRPAPRPAMMAAPLSEVVARKTSAMRFEKIDEGRRTDLQKYATSLRTYRDQRVTVETASAKARPAGPARPTIAQPVPAQDPGRTRPAADPRPADRLTAQGVRTTTAPVTVRPADIKAAPKPPEVRKIVPSAAAPVEVKKPDARPAAARTAEPVRVAPRPLLKPTEVRQPQPTVTPARPQPTSPIPAEIKRPQPTVSPARQQAPAAVPQVKPPSPIPAEIKRPQPPVAAPEARRPQSQTPIVPPRAQPQPTPPAARPQPSIQVRPAAPQAQPQRVERPTPPQAAPAPRSPAPRAEAPRAAQPAPAAPRIETPRAAQPERAAPRAEAPREAPPRPSEGTRQAPPSPDEKAKQR